MPIVAVNFGVPSESGSFSGRDIHLVRGSAGQSSEDLIDLVWVGLADGPWTTLSAFQSEPGGKDVDVTFQPVFAATDAGTEWKAFGIHVKKATGQVRVDKGPSPEHRIARAPVLDEIHHRDG